MVFSMLDFKQKEQNHRHFKKQPKPTVTEKAIFWVLVYVWPSWTGQPLHEKQSLYFKNQFESTTIIYTCSYFLIKNITYYVQHSIHFYLFSSILFFQMLQILLFVNVWNSSNTLDPINSYILMLKLCPDFILKGNFIQTVNHFLGIFILFSNIFQFIDCKD